MMYFNALMTVPLCVIFASLGSALEKPAAGAMNQLIPSLANAVISTLFPQLKLPNEMASELNGGRDSTGYHQALAQQGASFVHQGQNFDNPLSFGTGDFRNQRVLPPVQMFGQRPQVGQFIPSEDTRNYFGQMNTDAPAAFQSGRIPLDAQNSFAQALWQQNGRNGQPTPVAQFENLPPSDFSRGYPPVFTDLTNPDKQNLFQQPQSLHGRRDLPPSYVYPFADSGSVVQPGVPSGELYSLGEPNQETMLDSAKMLAMANPNVLHPERNIPLPPELREAIERKEMASLNNHAKRVGQDTGAFPVTLAMHKTVPSLVQQRREQTISSPASGVDEQSDDISVQTKKIELCPQCINADLEKMVGPWTQIYGNANVLKMLYATLSNLNQLLERTEGDRVERFSPVLPACVGIQVSRPRRYHSEMEIVFQNRASFAGHPQKLQGVLLQDRNISAHGKALEMQFPSFKLPLCLVKAAPSTSTMYSYLIWTETAGSNRCRSHHVFARHAGTFHRDHGDEVGKYLKQEYERKRLIIMSALEHPERCRP
uniref:Uncharacterized protein n=1 Tax=Trichuris muris TaxID=70415 RepID=A0A5S6PZV3_TRIMR